MYQPKKQVCYLSFSLSRAVSTDSISLDFFSFFYNLKSTRKSTRKKNKYKNSCLPTYEFHLKGLLPRATVRSERRREPDLRYETQTRSLESEKRFESRGFSFGRHENADYERLASRLRRGW